MIIFFILLFLKKLKDHVALDMSFFFFFLVFKSNSVFSLLKNKIANLILIVGYWVRSGSSMYDESDPSI